MNKDEALRMALEALETVVVDVKTTPTAYEVQRQTIAAIKEALAQPEQEPVAWNVVDPTGKIVATEMNSVRGWARIEGYKPTVEGLLGFHEQGWRVVPTTPPQRKPLPPQSPCEMTQAEGKMFKLGWLECEAAHGIKGE